MGILQKFVDGLLQSSYNTAITETVPYALWMLSAANTLHRPVSSIDVLGKEEMTAFNSHVSTLRSLGLTYVASERSNSFEKDEIAPIVEMRLEPEIDRLVNFKGYRVSLENRRKRIPSVVSVYMQQELITHVDAATVTKGHHSYESYWHIRLVSRSFVAETSTRYQAASRHHPKHIHLENPWRRLCQTRNKCQQMTVPLPLPLKNSR